ncbi:MAG: TetM/TetW/TetO/TetS family tetracycline resistance ribosomal protection protein [Clostridia bacterium]|nr:TetM/TetW/TetO/TetS family tetracycline resistance ribosomal protection protein [Clostridia bacterium]
MDNLRNIGIFAHVDAGKTTLSEQLLMLSGAIRELGSVDRGTAHTDTLDVERRRGISVKASCVSFTWKDTRINLIDTPGHTDFSAEIEQSMWALDGAILVVCAVEGVQPQTELLYEAFSRNGIPVILFLNKMDRPGSDPKRVFAQVRRRLSPHAAFFACPQESSEALLETVADLDDQVMERYLSGDFPQEGEIRERFCALAREGKAVPVLAGSALTGNGVEAVLDTALTCLPQPGHGAELSGVAFAVTEDRLLGRGVWVRLFGGEMSARQGIELPGRLDPVTGQRAVVTRKITQIRDATLHDAGSLKAGEIGVVYGLGRLKVGHVFGEEALLPRSVKPGGYRVPLLSVKAVCDDKEDMEKLRQAAMELSEENPLLEATWSKTLGELQFHVMGTIQQEVLAEELLSRYELHVRFLAPTPMYRETIAKETVGFCAYTMPKPCWAILKFEMKPGKRGSGIVYHSEVPVRQILEGYQHQVEQAMPLALKQGRLGWPVTDVEITLVDGNHHQFHTHPLDFIVATPWAIQDGLQRGGSVLLEPILRIRFLLPPECVGRVMSDVAGMRGQVTDTEADAERVILTARVPLSESMTYATTLSAITGGRGGMSVELDGYDPCPLEKGLTAPRRGVDPLDTSRYILAARSALEGGIFDLDA